MPSDNFRLAVKDDYINLTGFLDAAAGKTAMVEDTSMTVVSYQIMSHKARKVGKHANEFRPTDSPQNLGQAHFEQVRFHCQPSLSISPD
jgi:hypothetical protein